MPPQIITSPQYTLVSDANVFVSGKFYASALRLVEDGTVLPEDIIAPPFPVKEDLLLVHSPEWVEKAWNASLSEEDEAFAQLKGTKELCYAHILACGGTMLACEMAVKCGLGLHAGGGGHHALRDRGYGFCLVNDPAVGAAHAIARLGVKRVLIVDLDAHQGNGTASIFAGRDDVFTLSLHNRNIFPETKAVSSLDVELEPGCNGAQYMHALAGGLNKALSMFKPQLALYVAGADPYEGDLLGGLALTKEDLAVRDGFVFSTLLRLGIAVASVVAGGYARQRDDLVDIHAQTLREGVKAWRAVKSGQ